MLSNIFWLLNYVRENILEAFILPDLGISYWDFLIYLAIAGVVIVVLINTVQVTGGRSISASKKAKSDSERLSYDRYKENRSRNEEYKQRYDAEFGGD